MLREGQTGQEESSSPVVTPMPTLTGEALRPRRAETDAKGTDPVPNSAAERERMLNDADEKIRSMQENAKMEKVRQEQLLQDKLLKKKAKRAQGLQQKHDLALQSKAHILKSQLYNGVIRSMHQGADF
jgi:hypothetical protein